MLCKCEVIQEHFINCARDIVYIARQLEKCSTYLAVVGIHGFSHETFRFFQIFQSVPKGTAGAAEIPGCRTAIY